MVNGRGDGDCEVIVKVVDNTGIVRMPYGEYLHTVVVSDEVEGIHCLYYWGRDEDDAHTRAEKDIASHLRVVGVSRVVA